MEERSKRLFQGKVLATELDKTRKHLYNDEQPMGDSDTASVKNP
jgi:hypothetical protein